MFWTADDDAISEVADQMWGVQNASLRQFLAAVVVADQRESWRVDGALSTVMWLEMRFGISHAHARQLVRVGRGLVFCPEVASRFEAGHLSWDQVVACVDLVAYGQGSDAGIAMDAVGRTAAELERLARDARRVSLAEARERNRRRNVRLRDVDGGVAINGWLPDADGNVVKLALRRGADAQPTHETSGLPLPIEERQADALVDLCSAELATDADPDRATVVVHLEAHALAGDNGAMDLATLGLGEVISMATAHRLACDGRCQVVVDDLLGTTVDVAKTVHGVPPWLRRIVLWRDGNCRFHGCGRTALLHTHHIAWWSRDNGPTEQSNLVALCPTHHRLVHEGGWEIEGDPAGKLTFLGPNGYRVLAGPPGLRDDVRDALGLRWSGDPPGQAA